MKPSDLLLAAALLGCAALIALSIVEPGSERPLPAAAGRADRPGDPGAEREGGRAAEGRDEGLRAHEAGQVRRERSAESGSARASAAGAEKGAPHRGGADLGRPGGANAGRDPPLQPGTGGIAIEVQDASGRALPGLTVSLRALDPPGGAERAITGGRGEARFYDLAAGSYDYRVWQRDRSEVAAHAFVSLLEAERKHLTVRLGERDLSIAGRVTTRAGKPVAGLRVSLVRHRLASASSARVTGDDRVRSTETAGDGSFAFGGLGEGEYDVQTSATPRYATARGLVQAGTGLVQLVVDEGLLVVGTVRDARGDALVGVEVRVDGQRDRLAFTGEGGGYRLSLQRPPDDALTTLLFRLEGYRQARHALPAAAPAEVRLDAELEAVEDTAAVSGVVESDRGRPVAAATVLLHSQRQGTRYQAVSDEYGRFSVPYVELGSDYQLRLLADGRFRDHTLSGLEVPAAGLWLEIALEPLETGGLTGRMVDPTGQPVPGFRLWLLSSAAVRAAVPVTGDDAGFFSVEEAPAGPLVFDTRAAPRVTVSGIVLPPGGRADVTLVLDSGDHVLAGRVVDGRGEAIGGAGLTLSWSLANGGTRSTSSRSGHSDETGAFRFTGLAGGAHRLDVQAPGYAPLQRLYEVGAISGEVEVRLTP